MWWFKQLASEYLVASQGVEILLQNFVPSTVLIPRASFSYLPSRSQSSMKVYLSMVLDGMDTGRDLDRATVNLMKHIVLHGDASGLFSILVWSTWL